MTDRERMESTLRAGLPALSLTLSDAQINTLLDFGAAVLEQNKVMNLTAVKEPEAFHLKRFFVKSPKRKLCIIF